LVSIKIRIRNFSLNVFNKIIILHIEIVQILMKQFNN
jgi:hypothetical protein